MRFHLGTSKAPTAWTWSRVGTGSHSCGSGLKLSLRSRVEASELLRERWSVWRMVNVSRDETRFSDMVAGEGKQFPTQCAGSRLDAPGEDEDDEGGTRWCQEQNLPVVTTQPSFDRVCLPGTDFDDTLEVERGEVCQWRARVGPRPCPGSLSGVEGAIVCLPRLIRRERARRVGRGGDSSNLTHPRESSMRDKRQRVNLDRREKKEARKQEISREQSRVAGGYPRRLPSFSKRGWSCAAWATPPGLLTRRRRVFLSRAELTTRMARRIA